MLLSDVWGESGGGLEEGWREVGKASRQEEGGLEEVQGGRRRRNNGGIMKTRTIVPWKSSRH